MEKFMCGFSAAEITPLTEDVYLDGYGFRMMPAQGIRDPLYVRVCAMRSGGETFVIAVFDICGFDRKLKDRLRGFIQTATHLEDHQLAVCATHTHAGPACGVLEDIPINHLYWNRVGEIAADAVKSAIDAMCAGDLRFAFGKDLTLSFNRRGKDINDRRVHVCGFFDESGRLRGVLSSANCHPVCITDMQISADYPAILAERAEKRYPGVPFLFLQGRGADIDPHFTGETREEMCVKLGEEFADSVFDAISQMHAQEITGGALRSRFTTAAIPMKYPPADELKAKLQKYRAEIDEAQELSQKRYPWVEFIWHLRALSDIKIHPAPAISADFQIVTFADAVFVFLPFELLTPTGNAVEEMLRGLGYDTGRIFVFGYSNGTNGYLAPSAECGADGYEISGAAHWYGLPECCPDSEKTVLNVVSEMAVELSGR